MIERMTRAAKMDPTLFEEAERDTSLNDEALRVVLVVAVAAAIPPLITGLTRGQVLGAIVGALAQVILAVVFWYLWSYLVLQVGVKLFHGQADAGEVRRTIAYANTPNVLRVFGFIPGVGGLLGVIG